LGKVDRYLKFFIILLKLTKMKKIFYYLAIIVFALSACKKNDASDAQTPQEIQSKKTEALILDFKDKIENHLKDGGTYTGDSAVWYVEALLNYEKANNAHNFTNLKFYSDSILLNSTNGEFTIEELDTAYGYFNAMISATLEQSGDPSLFVDVIDVNFKETGLKTGTTAFEITLSTGRSTPINYTLFGEDEDWIWGFDLGACGDNQSTEVTDAADKLEYKFNHPLSVGQGGYFTSIVEIIVSGEDYDDMNNPGPWCDAMIFYYWSLFPLPEEPCIESEELNYYLSKFDYIKNDNRPAGKTFKSVDVYEDLYGGEQPNGYHRYKLYYGNFSEEDPH